LGLRRNLWRVAVHEPAADQAMEVADLQALRGMARPGLEPGTPRFSAFAAPVRPTRCRGLGLRLGLRAKSWRVAAQLESCISATKGGDLQGLCEVARPGLEPGTPRFSGSGGTATLRAERLQVGAFQVGASGRDAVRFGPVARAFGTSRRAWSPNELGQAVVAAGTADARHGRRRQPIGPSHQTSRS
jgi:hypothetical protein